MARLIDADALQLEPDVWGGMNGVLILGRSGGKTMAIVQASLNRMIENAPTIDAVPVVRCKDCRKAMLWRKPTDKVIGECFIRKMHSEDEQFCMVGADDFCSWGERRTDHENP